MERARRDDQLDDLLISGCSNARKRARKKRTAQPPEHYPDLALLFRLPLQATAFFLNDHRFERGL
jgi:hypothetical protein